MTLDELVTKYTLDDGGYKKGAQSVIAWSERTGAKIRELGFSITEHLGNALRMAFNPIAGLAAGFSIFEAGKFAVDAAVHFEYLQRTLAGVAGSAVRASSILDFVQKLAAPSVFTRDELADAATRLEAFGLTTEKYLPSLEKLGTIFGGNATDLMEYVDALGRIKGGMTGRGFEVLERAGMSKDMFKKLGLQFSKEGELLSPINQALDAIVKLVQQKFGGLDLADTAKAKFASFMDSLRQMAEKAGKPILDVLVPAMEKLTNFFSYLADSGIIEKVFGSISNLFSGKDLGDGLINAVAWLIAALEHIPGVMQFVSKAVEKTFRWIFDNARTIAAVMIAAYAFGPILAGIQLVIKAIKAWRAAEESLTIVAVIAKAAVGGLAGLGMTLAAMAAALAVGFGSMALLNGLLGDGPKIPGMDVFNDIKNDHDKIMDGFKLTPPTKPGDDGAPPDDSSSANAFGPGSLLDQVERNTRETARNTGDFGKYALGGGNLGKIGVTKAELNAIRSHRDIKIKVTGARDLQDAVERMFYDMLRQLRSEGAI